MLDTTQLHELRQRRNHYLHRWLTIRNRALVLFIVAFVLVIWGWRQVNLPVATPMLPTARYVQSSGIQPIDYAIFVLPCLVFVGVVVFNIPYNRFMLERARRAHKLLMSLLPEIPEYGGTQYNPNKNLATSRWRYVAFFGFVIIFSLVLGRLGINSVLSVLLIIGILIPFKVLPVLWKLRKPEVDDASRTHIKRNLPLGIIRLVVMLSVFAGAAITLPNLLMPIFNDWLLTIGVGWTISMALSISASYVFVLVPILRIYYGAYGRGDYAEALYELEKLRAFMTYPMYLSLRASIHTYQGDHTQAEADLRETITEFQHAVPVIHSVNLSELGSTLYRLGRNNEAERFLKAALDIAPDYNFGYINSAYYAIKTGDAALALQLIEGLPVVEKRPFFNFQRYGWAWRQTVQSLVYAANGQAEQAKLHLQRALEVEGDFFAPGWSLIHAHVAEIYQLLGDTAAAQQHRQRALDLNTDGLGGQLAQNLQTELA